MPEPSVAITLRIKYDLYQRALKHKEKSGKSVNQMIGEALEAYLRKENE